MLYSTPCTIRYVRFLPPQSPSALPTGLGWRRERTAGRKAPPFSASTRRPFSTGSKVNIPLHSHHHRRRRRHHSSACGNSANDKGDSQLFLGMTDAKEEGKWLWEADQSPVVFQHWTPGEPNNSGDDEDCASMNHQDAYRWNDVPCDWNWNSLTYMSYCQKGPSTTKGSFVQ